MSPQGPKPLDPQGRRPEPRRARALRVLSLTLAVLAFMPLVPPVDPLEGGGTTLRGAIEIALLAAAILLAAVGRPVALALQAASASPPLLTMLGFAAWACLTAFWSPNPVLSLAKGAELAMIACEAALIAWSVLGATAPPGDRPGLADDLSLALSGAVLALVLFNCAAYGSPLPIKVGEGQVAALGTFTEARRPRLMLAYAHPLVAGDLIALSALSLFVSTTRPGRKGVLLAVAVLLLVLTDARTAMAATPTAILFLWVSGHVRRYPLAIALAASAAVLALLLLAVLFVNGGVLQGLEPDEEFFTLNGRVELWEYLWPIFLENWTTGVGFYGSRYFLLDRWAWAGHTHHSLVEVALCLGVVGLSLFGALVGMAARAALKTRDGLLVGVCVYTFIVGNIDPILIDTSLPTFLFLLALFRVDLGRLPATSPLFPLPPRPRFRSPQP